MAEITMSKDTMRQEVIEALVERPQDFTAQDIAIMWMFINGMVPAVVDEGLSEFINVDGEDITIQGGY